MVLKLNSYNLLPDKEQIEHLINLINTCQLGAKVKIKRLVYMAHVLNSKDH